MGSAGEGCENSKPTTDVSDEDAMRTLAKGLEPALSQERLAYWSGIAGGDLGRALILHQRNTVVAGALFGDLQALEIALRNAMDRALQHVIGPDWLNDPRFLLAEAWRFAAQASGRLGMATVPRDKVIIQIPFKFWVDVFERRDVAITPTKVFRHGAYRKAQLMSDLRSLVRLRNDAMHHEPVIDRDGKRRPEDLNDDLDKIYRLLDALSPAAADWARQNSLSHRLLAAGVANCDDYSEFEVVIIIP